MAVVNLPISLNSGGSFYELLQRINGGHRSGTLPPDCSDGGQLNAVDPAAHTQSTAAGFRLLMQVYSPNPEPFIDGGHRSGTLSPKV